MKGKRAVYLLQITRDKLTEEHMRTLKCLILNIIRITFLEHIIIEVHFNQEQFSPFEEQLKLILKMLVTGYNLTEPEHSR